ncbi:MAG TPA: cytochrome c oxidase subunit 3 family protein [Polyangiaceae bacterium]|nr:cytochrome c oxidase subunit 3 family protein [Polyangiaceae bacterium]
MSESTSESAAHSAPPKGGHGAAAPAHGGHDAHGGHGAHGHGDAHLAHHFDTYQQQFDAGKLGIWLFLLTEVLFFSGLFCAYTVYRGMHPEVFVYAHYFLNTTMGAINTCVLLISSLTAAWAVRNAQLAQRKLLVLNILITIACACTFMVVKYFEYEHKFHDGLLPGPAFHPTEQVWELETFKHKHPEAAEYAEKLSKAAEAKEHAKAGGAPASAEPVENVERPTEEQLEPLIKAGVIGPAAEDQTRPSKPRNAHAFFSIYFFMTGLHGIHVLGGIGVFIWLLLRANKGQFGPKYFGPIDYAALYWHLVDLIWIYLFPLLYLIH